MRPAGRDDLVVDAAGARFLGRDLACALGRGGIVPAGAKREGDGATPAGMHRILHLLYRPDRIARPRTCLPVRAIGPRDLWCDDPQDPAYNRLLRAPHRASHERLRRADPLYDLVLVTGWNMAPPVPGMGSAIFVHAWRAPCSPTAGCVAFAPADLHWIVARLRPWSRLVVRG